MRTGIILLAVGLGLGFSLYLAVDLETSAWSLILIFLGIGFLVYSLILKVTQKEE